MLVRLADRWHTRGCGHLSWIWHRHPVLVLVTLVVRLLLAHDLASLLRSRCRLIAVVPRSEVAVVVDHVAARLAVHLTVALGTHALLLMLGSTLATLHLRHKQRQRCDELNHVLVVALHLACFLPIEVLAVPLLFLSLLARLFWLTEVQAELAVLENQFRLLLGLASSVTISEANKAQRSFRDHFAGSDFTKVFEELFKFFFGSLLIDVLDDQIEEVLRLLELVGRLLQFKLSLLLGLELTDKEHWLFIFSVLLALESSIFEVIDCFLGIFRRFEVDESEVFRLHLIIAHHSSGLNFTKWLENGTKFSICTVVVWKVLYVQVARALVLRCTNSVEARNKFADRKLRSIALV